MRIAAIVIAGVSVADPDAGTATIQVTFSVLHGTLTVSTAVSGGVAAGEVGGNGTGTVVLTSTLAKINATLADAAGLSYQGHAQYHGPDTLTMTSDDQGNTGIGGAQTDIDTRGHQRSMPSTTPRSTPSPPGR